MKSKAICMIVVMTMIAAGTVTAGTKVLTAVDVGVLNVASDRSVEYIIDRFSDDSGTAGANGVLNVGDSLRGIFDIDKLGIANSPTLLDSTYNQLTGIFQTRVYDKIDNGNGTYTFVFGPDPAFAEASSLGIAATSATLSSVDSGAMVLFYEDATRNFSSDNAFDPSNGDGDFGFASDVATVTDGMFWMSLGFLGALDTSTDDLTDMGEGWLATTDYDSIVGLAEAESIGTAKYGLNRLLLGYGDGELIKMLKRDIDGFSDVEANGLTSFAVGQLPLGEVVASDLSNLSEWPITDQANFNFAPTGIIPLPAAAWMGFALLGALGLGRRLRRRRIEG